MLFLTGESQETSWRRTGTSSLSMESEITTRAIFRKLPPREHVRRRPGMYVGGTDAHALHHLIYEVVDNSIDEALSPVVVTRVSVTTAQRTASATIRDNGVGIPVGRT